MFLFLDVWCKTNCEQNVTKRAMCHFLNPCSISFSVLPAFQQGTNSEIQTPSMHLFSTPACYGTLKASAEASWRQCDIPHFYTITHTHLQTIEVLNSYSTKGMFLNRGRESENPEGTRADTGRRYTGLGSNYNRLAVRQPCSPLHQ